MKQHILVVDDDGQIRELLTRFFEAYGYGVATASSAAETLQRVGETKPDLVVLDIGLGEEDGLKVLALVKSTHPETKVVMLTGMGFVEDLLQEAQQKGADGYVSKVLPLDELLGTVRRLLKPAQS
ncbi:MAG: response regulator [Verrucomicrobia bacterium]|nr:response regulator [Verrucomicrobiota bacterium]